MLNRIVILVCNLLWLAACLPGWLLFLIAMRNPQRAQTGVLRRLLKRNAVSTFGRAHGFDSLRTPDEFAARVPLAEYEQFADDIAAARRGEPFGLTSEPVLLLEPTSGSSGTPKWIPYTASLRREFQAALNPWIAWLFLAHPRLLFGRHYWAVSPNTPPPDAETPAANGLRAGFADDADYLGAAARVLARRLLAAPAELRHVSDPEAFAHLTLLFLLREKNLRLISIWHPSFLTLLLDAIPRHLPAILRELRTGAIDDTLRLSPAVRQRLQAQLRPDARRAAAIEALDLSAHPEHIGSAWPALEIVSCWVDGRPEPWLGRIRSVFPGVTIQGKGLLATEGVVTLPTGCGRLHPCAVRSHYFEFIEPGAGTVRRLWELEDGREYSVVLTTGGGLWRYRLHDSVCVQGFCGATPSLRFLGKDNAVSDMVGEKLDERHAAEALAHAESVTGLCPEFAMLVPDPPTDPAAPGLADTACGYRLLLELARESVTREADAARFAAAVEAELCRNFHYAHARNLGQLRPLRPELVNNGAAAYRAAREASGAKAGAVKFPALDTRPAPRNLAGRREKDAKQPMAVNQIYINMLPHN
jgi:hypothetical protein